MLHPHYLQNDEHVQRFLREVELTRTLNSPYVVRTFDVGQEGSSLYFTMEYLEGMTLEERLQQGPLTSKEALRLLHHVCSGLAAIHQRDIIHRDLKPANIFLSNTGQVKLMDFGLARPFDSKLTSEASSVGTAAYMAPEIWKGEVASHASDLYAFGIILFEVFSGKLPFDASSSASLMFQHIEGELPSLSAERAKQYAGVNDLIQLLLAKDPKKRPASAEKVLSLLQSLSPDDFSDSLLHYTGAHKVVSLAERLPPANVAFTIIVFLTPILITAYFVLPHLVGDNTTSKPKTQITQQKTQVVRHPPSQVKPQNTRPDNANRDLEEWQSMLADPASYTLPKSDSYPKILKRGYVWFDSSILNLSTSAKVAAWPSSLNPNVTLFQSEQNRQPIMLTIPATGTKVLSFNGKNQFLESPTIARQLQEFRQMTVSYIVAIQPLKRQQFVWSAHLPNGNTVLARNGFSADGRIKVNLSSENQEFDFDSSRVDQVSSPHIYTFVYTADSCTAYLDGAEALSIPIRKPLQYRRTTTFFIGQELDTNGRTGVKNYTDFLKGQLSEFAIFGEALTASDRRQLERYFAQKHGITLAQ
jgi:serine/threonine protein kinase